MHYLKLKLPGRIRMKRYWIAFSAVIIISFIVLSWVGVRIYQQAPPIPDKVITTEGKIVYTKDDIQTGQNVWQALGGMEVG
jgi:nitric oxide reductase subunit B